VRCPVARRARSRHAIEALGTFLAVIALLGIGSGEATAIRRAAPRPVTLTAIKGVTEPTAAAVRTGDPALYVTRQDGQVVALEGTKDPRPVLDLSARVRSGGEQGLLGLAFSPDGSKLYVHYSGAARGETIVDEYAFVDGRADPATRRLVLTQPQPQANHNGGELVFGPDQMLYLGLGDGGNQGDQGPGHAPEGNGQSLETLLGKILRIDPTPSGGNSYTIPPDNPFADGRGGRPEIWAYGLRNPWRFSFDTKTQDVWIGDVGGSLWEEIDHVPFDQVAGKNFGWPVFEGDERTRPDRIGDVVSPVAAFSHDDGNCSITGGYVYRGHAIPSLRGWYLFSDYCVGDVRALKVGPRGKPKVRDLGVSAEQVSSFGEDAAGELYVLSLSDGVFRIDPQ
jgi:glucose/arabinose dehydrogenase